MTTNGWSRDKQLIEFRLLDGDKKFEKIFEQLEDLKEQMAVFKVKASMWGIIGGSIPVLMTVLISLFVWLVKS